MGAEMLQRPALRQGGHGGFQFDPALGSTLGSISLGCQHFCVQDGLSFTLGS